MGVVVADLAPTTGATAVAGLSTTSRGAWVRQNLEIVLPLAGLVLMLLACFIAPLIFPIASPNLGNLNASLLPPFSRGHVFGTDLFGDDMLSRVLYGGRVSFEVGFGAQLIGFTLGSTFGMIAGLKAGVIESLIMRVADMLLAFPGLVLALTVATYLGPSVMHVIWALSFFAIPGQCRLARAQTVRLRERDFIVSARVYGQKDRWILVRHLMPNVYPNLLTFICLGVGFTIIAEAGLSFLGLGVQPPTPTWGNMLFTSEQYLATNPSLLIIPASFLFYTIMCLNLLGDALRSKISSN